MKKFYLTIAIAFAFFSCSEESVTTEQFPKEVEVSLDYSFAESGNMTRNGSSVYTDFYNNHIKTKQLTPKRFELTFTNKETGATATVEGNWDKKHSFKFPVGEYEVTGTSYPSGILGDRVISLTERLDSLYLTFNEKITITNNTEKINLTAIHDSYMLMFDKNDKTSVSCRLYSSGSSSLYLKCIDEIYYAFIKNKAYSIIINREDKTTGNIVLDKIPFEKGKYYYFNDIDNSFNIPPMEEGN